MSGIKVYSKEELPLKPDVPGAGKWAVGLEKSMLTYFELEPDTVFPEHYHASEQITMVLEGELTFDYDGKSVALKAGDVIAIPSNRVHSARTGKAPCRAVDAWSPPRNEFLYAIRAAAPNDMGSIRQCIERFRLDDEDLDYSQFTVVTEGSDIVGFGRIRPHKDVFELGCVGVIEEKRGKGIGEMIVRRLIEAFPSEEVYITTDLPGYFERFGFKKVLPGPRELEEKLKRVCSSKCREGAVAMVYLKQ